MNFMIIPADGKWHGARFTGDDMQTLAWIQSVCGGYVQRVPSRIGQRCSAYCNEDGKLISLPINNVATAMARRMAMIGPDDFMVGTVVLVGRDINGQDVDVPAAIADRVAKVAARYR